MSEHINNHSDRSQSLFSFSRELILSGNAKNSIPENQWLIDTVTDTETMDVIDRLLQEEIPFEKIKANIAKLINVFYLSLKGNLWEKPNENHFLHYLMLENREVEKLMKDFRIEIKSLTKTENPDFSKLHFYLNKLRDYELHYIKKENILFPFIEKTYPQYRCLHLMWSFHDDFRKNIRIIEEHIDKDKVDTQALYKSLGDLFFVVLPIIFREEQILFPVAYKSIPESIWADMLNQSVEVGWCYIDSPVFEKSDKLNENHLPELVDLSSGFLSAQQIILMLENLPVDITFVDENDEVRYFSGIKHRIFPRSNAIIGRKVQNCHPRESVHIVNEIVEAFRKGEKDNADFWINIKGRFILIRYFAMRDNNGLYKGTIEVSQDATDIRSLEGERRLLNW